MKIETEMNIKIDNSFKSIQKDFFFLDFDINLWKIPCVMIQFNSTQEIKIHYTPKEILKYKIDSKGVVINEMVEQETLNLEQLVEIVKNDVSKNYGCQLKGTVKF